MPSPFSITKGTGAKLAGQNHGNIYVIPAQVDFSKITGGVDQNEIVQAIAIPANHLVLGVHVESDTVSTNLADFDVGDGADVDGYHDGLDLTSAVNAYVGVGATPTLTTGTPNTIAGYQVGKYYSAADTIDLKVISAVTVVDGIVNLRAVVVDLTVAPRDMEVTA